MEIYTRNFRGQYSPPPGYDGTAFSDSGGMKHHPPEDEMPVYTNEDSLNVKDDLTDRRVFIPEIPEDRESDLQKCDRDETEMCVPTLRNEHTMEDLLRIMKGKIGREELIILLVMLLIASDGVGIEVLILALILIAG